MKDRQNEGPLLVLEELCKSFPTPDGRSEIQILKGLNLEVKPGESLAVVGPSGSGKSTLLSLMGALDVPTGGRVFLDGRDLATLSETERAGVRCRRIGFVFQLHHLLPQCTVWENVLVPTLALRGSRRKPGGPSAAHPAALFSASSAGRSGPSALSAAPTAAASPEAPAERARRLLERVGLADRLGHRPGELSGGECLRAAVARSLINRPALLLADEPTGSLDADTSERLAELLVEINLEEGVSLVVVTHSEALAARMGRRLRLARGMLEP
jgi:predicted ABC-type transport system involved in lysophospholipase L1 biosynthesis ATPase subunit